MGLNHEDCKNIKLSDRTIEVIFNNGFSIKVFKSWFHIFNKFYYSYNDKPESFYLDISWGYKRKLMKHLNKIVNYEMLDVSVDNMKKTISSINLLVKNNDSK
jgi:hypothetical protein